MRISSRSNLRYCKRWDGFVVSLLMVNDGIVQISLSASYLKRVLHSNIKISSDMKMFV